jgi:hypothetical protein
MKVVHSDRIVENLVVTSEGVKAYMSRSNRPPLKACKHALCHVSHKPDSQYGGMSVNGWYCGMQSVALAQALSYLPAHATQCWSSLMHNITWE